MMIMTRHVQDEDRNNEAATALYQVPVSLRFLLGCMGTGMALSFLLGCVAKHQVTVTRSQALKSPRISETTFQLERSLPPPVLGKSRALPYSTRYSSKRYNTGGTASESFLVRSTENRNSEQLQSPPNMMSTRQRFSLDLAGRSKENLNKRFSTESDIVYLLKELMETSTSTILSYHCDQVNPEHITCVGIATQGHVIVHTSPQIASIDVHGITLEQNVFTKVLGQSLTTTSLPENDLLPTTQRSQGLRDTRIASAFIHPTMLAKKSGPQTVVLVGGTVASLKQILLHVAVEHVILVDMDPVVETDGVDDPRVEQRHETALEWFAAAANGTIDAIFVEHPGPTDIVPEATRSLKAVNSMLVVKTSVQSQIHRNVKAQWIDAISDLKGSYVFIKEYDEGDANFLVAFSDDSELGKWFAGEAEIKLAIREKMLPPFESVDAADILSYHLPSRYAENAFCAENPTEEACLNGHGLDPARSSVPISSFEVKLSKFENAGRGVYAKHDIKKGAYTFLDTCVENVHFADATMRIIDMFKGNSEKAPNIPQTAWDILYGYADGYGFTSLNKGHRAYEVDPSIATFVNHGCNGTANVGEAEYLHVTEYSYSGYKPFEENYSIYNPSMDRNQRIYECSVDLSIRDIQAGEEIFNNYMTFVDLEELDEYAGELRAECAGAIGQISMYEMSAQGHRLLHGPGSLQLGSNITQLASNTSQSCRLCGMAQEIS